MNDDNPSYEELERRCRRAEARLEALRGKGSADRHRNLFDTSHAVMLVIDPDTGTIVDANRAAVGYYGWSWSELTALNINDLNTLSPEEIFDEMQAARQERRRYFHFRHRRADGSIRDVEVHSGPVFLSDQPLLHSIIHDITDRKKAEDALRDRTRELTCLLELGRIVEQDGITADGILEKAAHLLPPASRFPESAVGQIRWGDHVFETADFDRCPHVLSTELHLFDEQVGTVAIGYRPDLPMTHGRVFLPEEQTLVNALAERLGRIIERRRTEEKLRESEAHHRVIFEKSPLGMIRFSPDGTILDCNQRFVDFMGSSREKLIGFNTARQSTPEMRRTIRKALAGDTAAYENEYTSVTGGKTLCLRAVFNPVHPGRSPTEVIAALEDVSERKAAEKALKKTESLLNEAQRIARIGSYERNIETGQGWWSDEHYRLLGYEPGEVAHSFDFFLSHIHEEDRGRAETILRNAYGNVTSFAYDCRFVRRDGDVRHAHHTGDCILDTEGKTKWLRGAFQDITQRKRAEQALKKSEERYRDIFNNSLWGIFQSTVEGQFLSCNAAFAETFGYDSPEDLVSTITDISRQYYVEPANRRQYIRLLEENGVVENYEFKARRKDGSEIWVTNSTRVVRDDAGRLMYYEGAVTDITARKHAEHALKASEARHRIIFEKSPLGMVRFSPDGAIQDCNEKFVQLMGASREKLIGFNMAAQSTPEMRRIVHKALAGETAIYENEYTSISGGKTTWLRAVFSPITPDRSPTEVIAAIEDITDRKRVEKRLKESEERYRRLTENAQDIIWRTDWRGQVVFVNSAVQTLLGYSPGEIAGLDISQYMANSSIEQLLEKTNAIQLDRNSGNHFRLEIEYIAKNGKTVPFEINVVALKNAEGKIEGYEGVSRDITKRKRLERDLINARESAEAASRAKSEFIANMSHELRTPLNAILGYGQILLRDETLSKNQRQNIAVMRTSGEHLLTLINDILDIAKIEAGKLKLEFGPTDLRALITNAAAMLRAKAFKKQIQLVEHIDPKLPRFVEADEKRLRQVLLNLLSNAVKFTKEGSVTLRARPAGDRIAFSVSDTGVGIPENKTGAVFDAFQQLQPLASKTEGTGLGLTISQNLVELMGGRITVDSAVGRGSVFRFQIPLVDLNGKAADRRSEPRSGPENTLDINDAKPAAPIAPPPEEDISAIYAMARIGDLSAIVDYAEKMREADPEADRFCRTLENYAAECDMTAIRNLLERYMGGNQ